MGNLASQEARPDVAEAAVRSVQALELRIAGGSYRQIAKTLDVSVSVAHHYVVEALRETREVAIERAEELKIVELARLDSWTLKLTSGRTLTPRVVDTLLRISERRARLLGLDAPVKREFSGPGGGPIQIAPASTRWDLTKLSNEQLDELERMAILARAEPVAIQAISSPDTEEHPDETHPDSSEPLRLDAGCSL